MIKHSVYNYIILNHCGPVRNFYDTCTKISGMLRNRLQGRASQTLLGLGRLLQQLCNEDGLVTQNQLHQGLRTYHIGLTPEVSVLLLTI